MKDISYTEKEVEELLKTQRGNCYVAILTETRNEELAIVANSAPEPAGGKWRKSAEKKEYTKNNYNEEELKKINDFQKMGMFHPLTCCGGDETTPGCLRRKNGPNDGTLIATNDGWVCPCGEYTQELKETSIEGIDKLIQQQYEMFPFLIPMWESRK